MYNAPSPRHLWRAIQYYLVSPTAKVKGSYYTKLNFGYIITCFASVSIILQLVKLKVSKVLHWAFQLRASGSRGRSGPAVA